MDNQQQSQSSATNTTPLYIAIAILLLAVGLLGGYLLGQGGQPGQLTGVQAPGHAGHGAHGNGAGDPTMDLPAELVQFMAGWRCACGCDDPLMECHCNEPKGAQEIRKYVKSLYDDSIPLNDIRDRVIKRYGSVVVGGM